MIKIKIIVCYFGELPEWFGVWLISCSKNHQIDFLFITDQNNEYILPKNVQFIEMTLLELKKRFQKFFDFQIKLESPYKLCDYRPLYGLAFNKELKGYDFWGHCDLDMIFGDIQSLLLNKDMIKYGKIGKYGHLTIYKNSNIINNLFKQIGGAFSYEKVFSNNENYGFDEMSGMNKIAKQNKITCYTNLKIADMSVLYKSNKLYNKKRVKEVFCWINGKIIRGYIINNKVKTEEYMYLHFSGKKPQNIITDYDIKRFYINSKKIEYKLNDNISLDEIYENAEFINLFNDLKEIRFCIRKRTTQFLKKSLKEKIIWLRLQYSIRSKIN